MRSFSSIKNLLLFSVLIFFAGSFAFADVKLPKTFSNNAVLQRDRAVRIWGWADPDEKITVEFNGQKKETSADVKGDWSVELDPMSALGKGSDLIVRGKNTIKMINVVVGDVWVCSGQSNMEWALASGNTQKDNFRISASPEELSGDYSFIRYLKDPRVVDKMPQKDLNAGQWTVCKNKAQSGCTAVGFYFALRMHQELNIPVGLIHCNYGASRIESWLPKEAYDSLSEDLRKDNERKMAKSPYGDNFKFPCGMFNAKMNPWTKYAIRGAIWYQGESNGQEGDSYYVKQKLLIESWRALWGYDFPFYWVQLANFQKASDDPNQSLDWASLRDAQTKCMSIPKTGQAVTIDIGEANEIHPRNKFDVGNRLAAWSLAKDFGKKIVYASPVFKSLKIESNKAIVVFDAVGSGLVAGHQEPRHFSVVKNGELKRFALAGKDGKFYWAKAKIVGKDQVELTSEKVANPVFVRYAWQKNPEGCNLYNAEGFPATPFSVSAQ